MASRPIRDVLLRGTPDGAFNLLDVATQVPIATLPDLRAVADYCASHRMKVVTTPPSRQGATHAAAAPSATGAADPDPRPPCPTVRALRQGEPT